MHRIIIIVFVILMLIINSIGNINNIVSNLIIIEILTAKRFGP